MCIFLCGINKALNFRTYSYNISALDSAVPSILGFQTITEKKTRKAVSDMARYIDADALLNALKEERKNGNFVFTSKWIKEIIDNLPPADAVPKSEVEKIFEGLENRAFGFGACFVEMTRTTFDEIKKKYAESEGSDTLNNTKN